jgi:hypothetical protein
LDAVDAYGKVEFEGIEASIKYNPYLHHLIRLFDMLYKHGNGEMWFYDENG